MRLRRNKNGDSKKALDEARSALREVKARDEEVREIATALRRDRIQNHFSQKIYAIMTGRPEGGYMQ
jgi:hypothetical protein